MRDEDGAAVWWITLGLLVGLVLVKPLVSIPIAGPAALTLIAVLQLYVPLWRCERRGWSYEAVGLRPGVWRQDLRYLLWLSVAILPVFAAAYHLYFVYSHQWLLGLGLSDLAAWVPAWRYEPHWPEGVHGAAGKLSWLGELVGTHILGVALPEELFYRGYLQGQLQKRWPSGSGRTLGLGAVVAALLFALGHFVGEWHPVRLLPFFPALLFAWQRAKTGSIMGAVVFHGLCNVTSALLFFLYVPKLS